MLQRLGALVASLALLGGLALQALPAAAVPVPDRANGLSAIPTEVAPAIVAPAAASGWIIQSRASTGTTRTTSVYSGVRCTGKLVGKLRDGWALQGKSLRSPYFGWAKNSKNNARIRGYQCHTPLAFPTTVTLNGPKGTKAGALVLGRAAAWRPGDLRLANRGSITVRICWSLSTSTTCNMAVGTAPLYSRQVLGPDVDAVFCGAGHRLAVYQKGQLQPYARYDCYGSGAHNRPGHARLIKIDGCVIPCTKEVKAYRYP